MMRLELDGKYEIREVWGSLTLSPCPACGAERRHANRKDPRGPINLLKNSWHCFACDAGGKIEGLDPSLLAAIPHMADSDSSPDLPPVAAVSNFWDACEPIAEGSDVYQYLCKRWGRSGFDVPKSLARRLPDYAAETSEIGGWRRSKRALIFPLYHAESGVTVRQIIGRSILAKPTIKSCSLKGFSRAGCFLLKPGKADHVIVTEGELDWLAGSMFGPPDATVIGIFSGSGVEWCRTLPKGAHVYVATDHDDAGDKYAAQIIAALEGGRCHVIRST